MVFRFPRVLLPDGIRSAQIPVEDGRIVSVDPYDPHGRQATPGPETGPVHTIVDRAAVVFPGLVDTHVHVNEPGRSDWEGFPSATNAASEAGITTIVDMPLNSVPPTTTVAGLEAKRAEARPSLVDVQFWGGVVPGNTANLEPLADAGVRGFKCFLSPSGVDEFPHVSERDLREALPILARRNLPLLVHAESPSALIAPHATADPRDYATWLATRPPRAEVEAIAMMIRLCREFGAPIHIVHVAAADALPLIADARAKGLPLTAETCPHYLTFCAEDIGDGQTQFKCAPPIRERAHQDALWRALDEGTLDLIASDHSPCPPSMKGNGNFLDAWGGISSLQLLLPVTWTAASARGFGLERLGQWLSSGPARLARLTDRGAIAPGMRADFVIWQPDREITVDARKLYHRHKLTPYDGMRLRGEILATWVAGTRVGGLYDHLSYPA